MLSPWCCNQALTHILYAFDRLSNELNFHYEIDSGTLLGAVKFSNYIPWDIDGDLFVSSAAIFDFFQPGQKGAKNLQKQGISGMWNFVKRTGDSFSELNIHFDISKFHPFKIKRNEN